MSAKVGVADFDGTRTTVVVEDGHMVLAADALDGLHDGTKAGTVNIPRRDPAEASLRAMGMNACEQQVERVAEHLERIP